MYHHQQTQQGTCRQASRQTGRFLLVEVEHHPLVGVGAAVVATEGLHPAVPGGRQPVRRDRSIAVGKEKCMIVARNLQYMIVTETEKLGYIHL